jgi:hypothetical protein
MPAERLANSIAVLIATVLLAACATGTPPSPSPTPGPELSPAELEYALLDRFGTLSWCDPGQYPIPRDDEQQLAQQRLPEIQADAETYAAILDRLELGADADPAAAEVLAVYREWKLLNAVALQAAENGFAFDLVFETNAGLGEGRHVAGRIDNRGAITVAVDEDAFLVSCPICLARGTLIDTPNGPVPVDRLRATDLVWTLDAGGRRVAVPLLAVGSTPVPASHQVVHLVLDDGRELWVSPGHPLPDGRTLGDLRAWDEIDGGRVVVAQLVEYTGEQTFDILPAGATGAYWANGVLLASTLR